MGGMVRGKVTVGAGEQQWGGGQLASTCHDSRQQARKQEAVTHDFCA